MLGKYVESPIEPKCKTLTNTAKNYKYTKFITNIK